MKPKASTIMRVLLVGAIALMVAACASIGRPEGGPRDEKAPEFLRANPAPGSLNVSRNRIDLYFDENLKLDDALNKVVVSPVQQENARVTANGRHLSVEFRDSLKPGTTYVVDFGDAIRDLNEGNILDGFSYDFSTGDTLDSLVVSGMVFQARNLEPAQGMLVGIYSNLADSAISTLPLERIAKTNQYGQFSVRGLKPGDYRVYAIDDRNRDWHWDRTEDVAFYPLTVSPSTVPVSVTDTLRASDGTDSVVTRQAWHNLPDDLLLTWFNEEYRSQYLRDNKRTSQRTLELKFGAPLDSMPQLRLLNGSAAGRSLYDVAVMETRAERDSLVFWLADTTLVNQDSIYLEARYRKTDTLDCLVWQTDTLKMFYKRPKVKPKKSKERKDTADTAAVKINFLNIIIDGGNTQELHKPLVFKATEPLLMPAEGSWRLETLVDTLWVPVKDARMVPDSTSACRLLVEYPWKSQGRYRIHVDSAAIYNLYGQFNKPILTELDAKAIEEYGNIYVNITDIAQLNLPDTAAVYVELLDSSDDPVQTARVRGGTARFHYVDPATYYLRAYIDLNGDSVWTTGSVKLKRLPEDVFYYPKKLVLRKNWDLDQSWSLLETPVDAQKPNDIKRNKPKLKESERDDSEYDEEEEDYYGGDDMWGNGATYNNARNNSSRRSAGGGGSGFGGGSRANNRPVRR